MKALLKIMTVGTALLIAGTSFAVDVRYMDYRYGNEFASIMDKDTFVMCSACPPIKGLLLVSKQQGVFGLLAKNRISEIIVGRQGVEEMKKFAPVAVPQTAVISIPSAFCRFSAVHFALDSYRLEVGEIARMQSLIKESGDVGIVSLKGYTCDIGTEEHNSDLSLKRAQQVAKFLSNEGVSIGQIDGLGACDPVSESNKSLNRRVEILTAKENLCEKK